MCGRFTITEPQDAWEKRFSAKFQNEFRPRYNAAPSQMLPIILDEAPRNIIFGEWGFLPSWMKEKRKEGLINARAETLLEKPAFRNAFIKQRCLVLADGFYEWKKLAKEKIPFFITLKNKGLFAFAGIWTRSDTSAPSFAIITTDANNLVSHIHNRMPVILKQHDEAAWLDTNAEVKKLTDFFIPYPPDEMACYPVARAVSNPGIDTRELIVQQKI